MSSERPAKKARFSQQLNYATDAPNALDSHQSQVSSVEHEQSKDVIDSRLINQSNTQPPSQLCKLPSQMFALVCDYLDIDEKCCSFPRLCKAAKALFQPALCCRAPIWIFYQEHGRSSTYSPLYRQRSLDRNWALLAFLPYASEIRCHIRDPELFTMVTSPRKRFVEMLGAALDNPFLRSLSLSEIISPSCGYTVVSSVIRKMSQISSVGVKNLQDLELELLVDDLDGSDMERGHPVADYFHTINWEGLSNYHALKKLRFSPPCSEYAVPWASAMLDNLSNGLNHLAFSASHEYVGLLNERLRNPNWLPRLQSLEGIGTFLTLDAFHHKLLSGLSTVMKETKTPRSIVPRPT